jgi:hypothetical protein
MFGYPVVPTGSTISRDTVIHVSIVPVSFAATQART